MFTTSNTITMILLAILCIISMILLRYVLSKKNKKQLDKIFVIIFILLILWMLGLMLQIICIGRFDINPIYFEYFVYIIGCYLPVVVLLMALTFARTKITFSKKYLWLFVIPTLSILLLWTNDYHHLFYEHYSVNVYENVYGSYFYVHYYYTMALFAISLFIFMKYSIKNSGFFSRQAMLILVGTLIPIIINALGFVGIISTSTYTTPITLAATLICFSFAIFRFNLFKLTPIALQRIVDRISDSYIVLNENYLVTDFNETFLKTFRVKNASLVRGKDFEKLLLESGGTKSIVKEFKRNIEKVINNEKTESFELYVEQIEKYFNIEVNSIIVDGQSLGILVLFKDITQHKKDMEIIKANQDMLVERERLASLGQMVGGIAHSLKTPIFSISGGIEGLNDLVSEFDESIEDPEVNTQDMHDIAHDMNVWLQKMKEQLSYMSEVITTVKGQAVNLSGDDNVEFTINELFSHVNILMRHELQTALVKLNIENEVSNDIILYRNINSLVQVLNNLISNSIQAYNGAPNKSIDLKAKLEGTDIIISVKDYGPGLPDTVKDKLFKEMITTKGKEGTGLGLFMSYSMIKAKFNGDIKYKTSKKGTEFTIYLPITKDEVK